MTTSITPLDAANVGEGTGGSIPIGKEVVVMTRAVTGGTLYITALREGGMDNAAIATSFVPESATPMTRYLRLTDAKSDTGIPMTATAGTPTGTVAPARTDGTSLVLVGETTSASAKTDKAVFEFVLPDTYIAGAAIPVSVDCNYTGSGTVTAASTTMTLAAYSESGAGVEASLSVTGGAQEITSTAELLSYSVAGTGLAPGSRVIFELVMLVTTSAGAATGQINSISYNA